MTETTQLRKAMESAQDTAWSEDEHIASYYGAYRGRWYHRGVAICFNGEYTMTVSGMLLKHCPSLGEPDQIDNLGFNTLWSWNRERFSDGDNPVECDEE
tara:strand:+ start:272 stop:568 length:297 start_codon:yes stop_codon:yes gene_type:complete